MKEHWTLFVPLALVAVLIAGVVNAEEQAWKFRKEKHGIKVYTRKVDGSPYKAVKGETVMEQSVATLVTVIRDAKACPEWADLCKRSHVTEQVTPSEAYVYTHNNLPWPVSDRDVLAHVVWSLDKSTGAVTMVSKAIEGRLDKEKGIVRLEKAQAKWIFTPLPEGRAQVVFEAHMDPNGPLPGWLLNRLIADSPIATLTSFAKQAAKEKYQGVKMPF